MDTTETLKFKEKVVTPEWMTNSRDCEGVFSIYADIKDRHAARNRITRTKSKS
jgi:hypothetical protein